MNNPIVEPEWLNDNLKNDNVIVLMQQFFYYLKRTTQIILLNQVGMSI